MRHDPVSPIDWSAGPDLTAVCPLCGDEGGKPRRLVVRDRAVGGTAYTLYGCPACAGAFFDPPPHARYEQPAEAGGAVKFYVEQGAGIDVMLEPTAVLDRLEVRRYLEIGCGFGFSLDYAQRARGWLCRGYDPGLLAQAGRVALGLDIRSEYVTADTPLDGDGWDAVLCSEVIEHVHNPAAFLAVVRRAMAPGATLVLTTPNAAGIAPDTDPGALLPLLSAGYHTMLFSADALRVALRRCGFAHVWVGGTRHQLQAVASDRPLPDPLPFDRASYAAYLAGRAALHAADTPLGGGFRYRLLKELVNAGRYGETVEPFEALREGWSRLYGVDPSAPDSIRIPEPGAIGFDELAERFPLNLCGVLYGRGIVQLNALGDIAGAARSFGAAAAFAATLRDALQAIGTDDGETADLGGRALCEQVLALGRTDPAEGVRRYAGLGDTRGAGRIVNLPADLLAGTRRRLIVTLVNGGAHEAAEALVEAEDETLEPNPADPAAFGEGLSLIFVLGMLALNHRADHADAARRFHRVYALCRENAGAATARTLLWPARYHQALALDHAGSRDAARDAALDLRGPVAAGDPDVPAPYRAWAEQLLGA